MQDDIRTQRLYFLRNGPLYTISYQVRSLKGASDTNASKRMLPLCVLPDGLPPPLVLARTATRKLETHSDRNRQPTAPAPRTASNVRPKPPAASYTGRTRTTTRNASTRFFFQTQSAPTHVATKGSCYAAGRRVQPALQRAARAAAKEGTTGHDRRPLKRRRAGRRA